MDPRVWRAIAGVMVAALLPVSVCAETGSAPPLVRLDVLLTVAPELPDAARAAMTREADAIWRAHGVAMNWRTGAQPPASHDLRVLVVGRRKPGGSEPTVVTVGQLVRPRRGQALALISIHSARRLLANARGRDAYRLAALDDERLGVILGRALAHEIGHYLLDTPTHADRGLMRPQFSALEFADPRDDLFALDAAAADWLKSGGREKFAYIR